MNNGSLYKEGRAIRLLEKVCRTFAIGGALVIALLSVTTVISVLGRYFFNTPLSGDVELVEMGCAIAVSMFLPYCQLRQGNVIVDFFTLALPAKFKNVLDAVGCILLSVVAALLAWRMGLGGSDLFRYNDQTMILQLPTWWAFIFIVPAMVLLALTGLATAVRSWYGQTLIDPIEKAMDEI